MRRSTPSSAVPPQLPARRAAPRPGRRPGARVGTVLVSAALASAAVAAGGVGVLPAVAATSGGQPAGAVPPVAAPAAPAASATASTLGVWGSLRVHQALVNATTVLVMQSDGNLVLYAGPGVPMWASHTAGNPGAWAQLKPNAQFVVRDRTNKIIWASPLRPGAAPQVVVESSGNYVVRAGGRPQWTTGTGVKGYAVAQLSAHRWSAAQWPCLDRLWQRESGWNPQARNRSSGAYGIPQALPGQKMASEGGDWRTNHQTQIDWGLSYITDRYGAPCAAWSHSQRVGWYGTTR